MGGHWHSRHCFRSVHLPDFSISSRAIEHGDQVETHSCRGILCKASVCPFHRPSLHVSARHLLTQARVIAVAAVRLYYLESTFSSPDRTLEAAYYFVSTQCQIGYAIMSTTITGLGPFLRPFSKSYTTSSYRHSSYANAASFPASSANRSNLGSRLDNHATQQGDSYQMEPIQGRNAPIVSRKGSSTTSGHLSSNEDTFAASSQSEILPQSTGLQLRPDVDALKRDTAIYGGHDVDDEDVMSRMSDESRRMIITKKTELRIEHDRRSVVIRHQSKGDLGAV